MVSPTRLRRSPFFHDAAERPIPRPQDPGEQKDYWSGKAHDHTVKNVLLADRTARVWFLSDTYEGAYHEKPIADATPYPLPPGSELLQDVGYLGFTLAGVTITMPHKKAKGQRLTDAKKAIIARLRASVCGSNTSSARSNGALS